MKRLILYPISFLACTGALGLLLRAQAPAVQTGTWTLVGSMAQARAGASAVLLPDGLVLIAGGVGDDGLPTGSTEILATDGTFAVGAPMNVARSAHVAVMLGDGRVLVAGGTTTAEGGATATDTAEIYDPSNGSWSLVGSLSEPRAGHTATVLSDGTVLIAGGENASGISATLERFDPTANSFTLAGALSTVRSHHAAAVLDDGRVLIIGGWDGAAPLASVDVFDAATGTVSSGPALATARAGLSATRLLTGNVLVVGGHDGASDLASAEIYRVGASAFISTASALAEARRDHLAVLLPDNHSVLIVGGTAGDTALASAELFLPADETFSATAPLTEARAGASASRLYSEGWLVVAGGVGRASAELYRFATVRTDKADYVPGDTVMIAGTGWQPGETVSLELHEVPQTHADLILTAIADDNGEIFNSEFQPEAHDAGVRFYLTARGAVSQAQATFTDAPPPPECDTDDDCDDGDPCTDDVCVGRGNCQHNAARVGTSCDDGNPCTVGDSCVSKECIPGNAAGAGTVCRESTGACDAAEVCNGTTCPDDAFEPETTECRAANGACDAAEFCTGSSAECPADSFASDSTVCRASNGICDPAEFCTGSSPECPANSFAPSSTECRPKAGDCDAAEFCTGSSAPCPSDIFAGPETVCRPASGTCDAREVCTGLSTSCPEDIKAPNNSLCEDGNLCTLLDTCQAGVCTPGTLKTCLPSDQCHNAGTCEPTTGLCSDPIKQNGSSCNDGNACTTTDTCIAGVCTGGLPPNCDDRDVCTLDACVPTTGCTHTPLAPLVCKPTKKGIR